jgi:hypothetical protein
MALADAIVDAQAAGIVWSKSLVKQGGVRREIFISVESATLWRANGV